MPRRAERNDDLLDVQHPGLMRKSFSIDLVSVSNQIPGPLLQRARLEQLARRPFGSRMLRDIKMHQPTRTPQRIRAAHLPYQIPQVPPNRGPTPSASTLPCPVELEAPAVPPHHGLEPHHLQGTPPILPEPRHHDPEDPVHLRQPRPWLTRFPHGELLPQREILQRQLAARANRGAECPNKDPKPSDHDRPNSRSLRPTRWPGTACRAPNGAKPPKPSA